jgi:NodT family efflux transporter outer membrane factor (OMF) lipoprotein
MRISAIRLQRDQNRLGPLATAATVACVCAVALSGCADVSMKEYRRPDSAVNASWSRAGSAPVSATQAISPDWWKNFGDPYLDSLVARAIQENIDVRILAARIQVANAGIGEARAGALPTLDAGAGASFEKSTGQKLAKQYNLGTQVSWDIDIWGKVEKGAQAQTAEYRATEADWRAGYLTLVSSVSTSYFQILQFDEQIAQQQRAIGKNREILAVYDAMFRNGLLPNTRLLQQRAELNRLNTDLIELQRLRAISSNALATLLGVPAGDFRIEKGALRDRVRLPVVPAGLPSDLLKRRPDIVAAEYRVLASYNLVGQAKLAQLPSVSLTGRGGTSSFALTDLLRSVTLGFLPSINFPIFDPSTRARIRTSEAQNKLSEEEYRRTVLAAFEEVENALVNLDAHKKQRQELEQQSQQLETVSEQIRGQLREGIATQLDVFESERSVLGAQLALLANHQQILADTVTLYKALGGGWPNVDIADKSQWRP